MVEAVKRLTGLNKCFLYIESQMYIEERKSMETNEWRPRDLQKDGRKSEEWLMNQTQKLTAKPLQVSPEEVTAK